MKIIVFGANGMLGRYVSQYLKAEKITREQIDASNTTVAELTKLIDENSVVINCIGMIPQKYGSENKDLYLAVNSLFPHQLEAACVRKKSRFIHITTDCVFSGERGKYDEYDFKDEENIYGMSKAIGESLKSMVIRTSIIGEELKGKKSLLEWCKSQEGKEVNGYVNHLWNGVTCLELAKFIKYIIDNELFWQGVKHIFSPRIVSKYELVCLISTYFNLDMIVKENRTEKNIDKSLTSFHNCSYVFPDIEQQIKDLRDFKLE